MSTREERLKLMQENGFDVDFSVLSDEIADVVPDIVDKSEIFTVPNREKNENGYIINNRLYRRFVMSQYFKMNKKGFSKALAEKPFSYQFSVIRRELRNLAELEEMNAAKELEERSYFFNTLTLINFFTAYNQACEKFIVPGKYPGNAYSFIQDYAKLSMQREMINNFKRTDINYRSMLRLFNEYMNTCYISLPSETQKISVFKETYRKAGAYYTLKNMIMYHNCFIRVDNNHFEPGVNVPESYKEGDFLSLSDSMKALRGTLKKYTAYHMHSLWRRVIETNNFDFWDRMNEIHQAKKES